MTSPDTASPRVVDELRALISAATQEDLSDGGRYFAESCDDLTRCRHEEIGEYQHAADGELIEWLWNKRRDIAALYAARSASASVSVVPDREAMARAIYRAMTWAADQSCTNHHPDWIDGGNSFAQDEARKTADAILAFTPAPDALPDSGEAHLPIILTALQAYRSLPAGTVREFPMLETRANDPNDSAHKVLTARLPGLREEYEKASVKVACIDAAITSLASPSPTPAPAVAPDRGVAASQAVKLVYQIAYRYKNGSGRMADICRCAMAWMREANQIVTGQLPASLDDDEEALPTVKRGHPFPSLMVPMGATNEHLATPAPAHTDGDDDSGVILPLLSAEQIAEIRTIIAKEVPAIRDVIAERQRQVQQEGWTREHDDDHLDGELAKAGASYAIGSPYAFDQGKPLWPWDLAEWKQKDRRRNLVRGAALIIAEIERLDRKEAGDDQ